MRYCYIFGAWLKRQEQRKGGREGFPVLVLQPRFCRVCPGSGREEKKKCHVAGHKNPTAGPQSPKPLSQDQRVVVSNLCQNTQRQ